GQEAVADLAPGLAAQGLGLAGAERREVVVHEEGLADLAEEGLDALLVVLGPEGAAHQRLGLAAGEQRRAVGPGQDADLARDRADLVVPTAVDAALGLEGGQPGGLLLERIDR